MVTIHMMNVGFVMNINKESPLKFLIIPEKFLISKKIYTSHGEISTVFLALGSVTHAFTGCSTKTELHQMHHP